MSTHRLHPAVFLVAGLALSGCGAGGEVGSVSQTDDVRLAALSVSGGTLAPAFDPAVDRYVVEADRFATVVTVTPTAATPGATIAIDGEPVPSGSPSPALPVADEVTTVPLVVTSPDGGSARTHALEVTRAPRAFPEAYVKASNTGEADAFGRSVAVSGDTLVVGAPGEDSAARGVDGDESDDSLSGAGAVYVFVREDAGWRQQAYLKASNSGWRHGFGGSVAISGDTIVVGAAQEGNGDVGVNGNQQAGGAQWSGAAYVFARTDETWRQQAYLKASNTGAGDAFGSSVAISGDTLVVGASDEDSNARVVDGSQTNSLAANSGAAYVFVRDGSTWRQQAYLKASNTDNNDRFGGSVAISGDTIVVGAHGEDSAARGVDGVGSSNSASWSGAAYVFARDGDGRWHHEAYLKASNTDAGDHFGTSVAAWGDYVAVSAPQEDSNAGGIGGNQASNSAPWAGAVYVFRRRRTPIQTEWTQHAYVKPALLNTLDKFGSSVALWGDTLVVGAAWEDSGALDLDGDVFDNGVERAGAAYVFRRDGGTWSQQAYVKASNTGEQDFFGTRVSIHEGSVAVSATGEDSRATGVGGDQADDSASAAGAVYVLR